MELNDIASVIIDGQVVYYRRREVIAIGVAAARFVGEQDGTRFDVEGILIRRVPNARENEELAARIGEIIAVQGNDSAARVLAEAFADEVQRGDTAGVSSLPPTFRFTGVDDPEAVVADARSRGLRVQLNHVFFAHCGCGCDPCCEANPYGAFPLKATPLKATPLKATPLKATAPASTTAEPAATAEFSPKPESDPEPQVHVWILDTGVSVDGVSTPLPERITTTSSRVDEPDKEPQVPDKEVDPVAGHGTFIAGIIEELIPECAVRVVRVIDSMGHVEEQFVADTINNLFRNAVRDGVDLKRVILNLSFGGALDPDSNWCLRDAIAAAQEGGVVVVASAGNDASCRPVYPGNFPGVTAVGALDSEGDPASFTNRGNWVDACALGVDIVSTFFNFADADTDTEIVAGLEPLFSGGWAKWSGTSFAAPVVVAAIAQVMSQDHGLSAADARETVLAGGVIQPCLGVGVFPKNVERLLEGARIPTTPNG